MAGRQKPSATPMSTRQAKSVPRPRYAELGVSRVVRDQPLTAASSSRSGGRRVAIQPPGSCAGEAGQVRSGQGRAGQGRQAQAAGHAESTLRRHGAEP